MTQNQKPRSPRRRAFLAGSVAAVGTLGTVGPVEAQETRAGGAVPEKTSRRPYNGPYEGETLSRVAFPLGGMGAGMICLEGTGALSHVSLRHKPEVFNEPCVFAAICVKGDPNRRARARRPGAGLEDVRPPGHRQRRRGRVLRPAAVRAARASRPASRSAP